MRTLFHILSLRIFARELLIASALVRLLAFTPVPANLNSAVVVFQRIFTLADGRIPIDYRPLFYMAGILLVEWSDLKQKWMNWAENHPNSLKWIAYVMAIALMFTFAGASSSNFLYFQF